MSYEQLPDEWKEWVNLTPLERFRRSEELSAQYLAMGGSLDPDPDPTSPFNLLSVPDLIPANKTQRSKDWPVIELLVAIHYRENGESPRPDWIAFWLKEARAPEMLVELCARFSAEAAALTATRPLLTHAIAGDLAALRAALDVEARAEQQKGRAYWEPLRRELESLPERTAVAAGCP